MGRLLKSGADIGYFLHSFVLLFAAALTAVVVVPRITPRDFTSIYTKEGRVSYTIRLFLISVRILFII